MNWVPLIGGFRCEGTCTTRGFSRSSSGASEAHASTSTTTGNHVLKGRSKPMSGVEWNTGQPQEAAKPRLISVRRINEDRHVSSPTVKYDHSSRAM